MTMKVGMLDGVIEYYHVCSIGDPGLTMTYLGQCQIWSLMLLCGEKVKQWIFRKRL